jgi:hypothetical protein
MIMPEAKSIGKSKSQDHSGDKSGRVEAASTRKHRHVIRYGPDWGDILVIEGNAPDKADTDVTKDWADEHGPQSCDAYNAWAKPEA